MRRRTGSASSVRFGLVADLSDAKNREGLPQLLEGRSDEEINEFVNAAGVDTVLSQVFDAMKERLDPQKSAGQTAVVQWDVKATDGTHSYQFKVDNGSGSWTQGTP